MTSNDLNRVSKTAPIIFAIIGGVVGVTNDGFFGGLVAALVGYLLGTVKRLQAQVDLMARAFDDLETTVERSVTPERPRKAPPTTAAAIAPVDSETPAAVPDPPSVPPTPPPAVVVEPTSPVPMAVDTGRTNDTPRVIPPPLPPEPAADVPRLPPPTYEPIPPSAAETFVSTIVGRIVAFFTTGNVVAKVGAAVLFVGLAFLARFAVQRFQVPIELRLIGIGAVGLTLLLLGWRLRRRADAYGLILQGTGVAVMYLTVFAAARVYDVVPLGLALAVMTGLVVLTWWLAVRQDSEVLAGLATTGGFLAPVLTSSGRGQHVALFSYYALLNLGILVMTWNRRWRSLHWLGFVFTFGISVLWGHEAYRSAHYATTQPFLIFFFLLYVAIGLRFTRRDAHGWQGTVDAGLIFGTPIVAFGLQAELVDHLRYGLAISAGLVGTLYLGLAAWLHRQDASRTLLGRAYLALGIVFASLALPLAVDDQRWTVVAWALEGAGLLWVGVRQQRALLRLFGVGLQVVAPLMLLVEIGSDSVGGSTAMERNATILSLAVLAVTSLFSAYVLRDREQQPTSQRVLAWLFLGWGTFAWVLAGASKVTKHLDGPLALRAFVLFLALSSASLTLVALNRRWPAGHTPGWLLLPMTGLWALASLADDGLDVHPLAHVGWLAWPCALAVIFGQLFVAERRDVHRLLRATTHVGATTLAAMLGGWSAAATVGNDNEVWAAVAWGLVPVAAAFGIQRFGPRLRWPIAARPELYLGAGAVPLMTFLGLWILGANGLDGQATPLPTWPLLNPIDVAQALVLLVLADWARRLPGRYLEPLHLVIRGTVALVAFVGLNGAIARFVHWTYGVDYDLDTMLASPTFQTAVAVVWTILAITGMIVGSRRSHRALWTVGAGLLALVVIKLFVVDLSATGTVARIVSFLTVGALTLAVGYLAPRPPRPDEDTEAGED